MARKTVSDTDEHSGTIAELYRRYWHELCAWLKNQGQAVNAFSWNKPEKIGALEIVGARVSGIFVF